MTATSLLRTHALRASAGRHLRQQLRCSSNARTLPWTFPWTVRTPQLRDLRQAKFVLPNGLSAVVVSDPGAPTTSAAVSIEAGSWMDGVHAGTAHFLEHMLFLGSVKFPDEAGFERFILDSGGSFNGYTASDHSMYYFSNLNPTKLDGAVDRFSRFFYEPLFSPSCVARERRAVDEEHRKNIETDSWRVLQVKKELAHQNHPFAMFSTGNLETMQLIDRDLLIKWFERNYCASRMHIVMQGTAPVDALVSQVEQAFGSVQNRSVPKLSTFGRRIFPTELQNSVVWIEPVKDLKELSVSWEIDPKFVSLETKPAQLVAHVLGYEGVGSLLSLLRAEGLAEGLSAGESTVGAENVNFNISVALTEKGIAQWQSVLARIMDAVAAIRDAGPYPSHIVDEIRFLSKVSYEFQQRSSGIATRLCGALRREGIESFPNRTYTIERFDPNAVHELLNALTPKTAMCTIVGRNPSIHFDRTEKWMGAKYTVFPIKETPALHALPPELAISYPKPNEFVPTDLKLLHAAGSCATSDGSRRDPVPLVKTDGITLLHFPDDEFLVPEASYIFQIKTPSVRPGDPRSLCLLSLYLRFVEERLTELSYDASSAGLHYNVWNHLGVGLGFSVDGYSQKSLELLRSVVDRLREPSLTQAEFDIFRQSLERGYRNASRDQPIRQAGERFSYLLYDEACLSRDLVEAASNITLQDLHEFASRVFERRRIEAFVGGNVDASSARSALDMVCEQLPGTVCSADEVRRSRVRGFDDADPSVNEAILNRPRAHVFDVDAKGNAIFWGVGLGRRSDISRTGQHMLGKLIQEPFYTALRTQQQTGYMVSSGTFQSDKRLFLHASVQSNVYDPRDLLSRIELFMETFLRDLNGEDKTIPARFESIRDAAVKRLKQPFDRLSAKINHLNHIAFEEDGDYGLIERRIKLFEEYSLEDLRQFAQNVLRRDNMRRLAVLACGSSPENFDKTYVSVDVDGSPFASSLPRSF